MNPRIRRNGELLSRKEGDQILKKIMRSDCHLLGRERPEEIDGICRRNVLKTLLRKTKPVPGWYVGPGVCLLKKFIERKSPCAGCTAAPIVEQLNWLFAHRRRFAGFTAEWPERKRKRRKAS